MIRVDEIYQTGVDDGLHGILHVIEVVIAVRFLEHLPVLVLAPTE